MLADSCRVRGPSRRRRRKGRKDLFSHPDSVMRTEDFGEQHQELVAAVTAHGIRITDGGFQAAGHELQDLIAHRMPVGVVDLLEAVEIHEQDADVGRPSVATSAMALSRRSSIQRPIRRAGQLIVLAVAGQLVETADRRLRGRCRRGRRPETSRPSASVSSVDRRPLNSSRARASCLRRPASSSRAALIWACRDAADCAAAGGMSESLESTPCDGSEWFKHR